MKVLLKELKTQENRHKMDLFDAGKKKEDDKKKEDEPDILKREAEKVAEI